MPFDQELCATSATTRGPITPHVTSGTTNGPTIDLKHADRVQNLEATLRVYSASGTTARLTYFFQDSADGTTFVNMPGALVGTTGPLLGFAAVSTSDYASTDAVAPNAPNRVTLRCTKRYLRGVVVVAGSTDPTFAFSVTLEPVGGAKQATGDV